MISHLHYLALIQQVPDAYDESMGDKAALESLAQQISPEDLQLYYQIGLVGRRDLPLAPEPQQCTPASSSEQVCSSSALTI